MITVTDILTGNPVQISINEITAIKEGSAHINGQTLSCTRIFIMSEAGFYALMIDAKESPAEIGRLMIEELTGAGEEIRNG